MKTIHSKIFFKYLSITMVLLILSMSITPIAYGTGSSSNSVYITAETAIVTDGQTGEVLYEKNADKMMVPASMTKIMTAYIIYEELEKGSFTKETLVPISANAAKCSTDNANYPMAVPLTAGASYSVDALLNNIIVPSASASCIVMAEYISGSEAAFVERMNETAKRLGMQAQYKNCHGAFVHYMTARDMAILTKECIDRFPDILTYTSKPSITFNGVTYNNTNKLLTTQYYEGADGFKTGTITAAGYCVTVTAVKNGRRVIAVVMKSSSTNQRFVDGAALLDYGFQVISKRDAARASTEVKITAAPTSTLQYTPLSITAQLFGVTSPYTCSAQWTLDGQPIAGYGNALFFASDNKQSTLTYALKGYNGDHARIGLILIFPDGTTKKAETEIAVKETSIDVNGYLNVKEATVYKGTEINLKASVSSNSSIELLKIPVAWQIDEKTITGFSNNEFTVKSGQGSSSYFYTADTLGTHTISLTINPDNLPGLTKKQITAKITVLDPATAADTTDDTDEENTENNDEEGTSPENTSKVDKAA